MAYHVQSKENIKFCEFINILHPSSLNDSFLFTGSNIEIVLVSSEKLSESPTYINSKIIKTKKTVEKFYFRTKL